MSLHSYIVSIFTTFFLLSCGGGGGSDTTTPKTDKPKDTPPNTTSIPTIKSAYSFKDSTLYSFSTTFKDNTFRYQVQKLNSKEDLLYYFVDKSYTLDTTKEQIIIDTDTRISSDTLEYTISSNGDIEVSSQNKKLFAYYLMKKSSFSSDKFTPYHKDIKGLKGIEYIAIKKYFVDFYRLQSIVSKDNSKTIDEFINSHRAKVFIGSDSKGLIFKDSSQVIELKNGKSSNGGKYEMKKINNKDILFVYPIDTINYPSKICYILDFGNIWKSSCHIKNEEENLTLYNNDIYQQIEKNLQDSLISIQITI